MPDILSTKSLSFEAMHRLEEAGISCRVHDFVQVSSRQTMAPILHDTLLVSSQNALHACDWSGKKVHCVGDQTADLLRNKKAQLLSVHQSARAMMEHVVSLNQPCTFVCGSTRMSVVESGFSQRGVELQIVEAYDTTSNALKIDGDLDAILFFSPSGVHSFHQLNSLTPPAFCIGPTTGDVARTFGHAVMLPPRPSKEALVDLVLKKITP